MRRFIDWVTASPDRIEWVSALVLIIALSLVLLTAP